MISKKLNIFSFILLIFFLACNNQVYGEQRKLKIGTTLSVFSGLKGLTYDNLKKAKESGIDFYINKLNVVRELKPNVILFHPSWRLGLNERPQRIAQFAKSSVVLNNAVKEIGAIMVVENLLGFELLRNEKTERPLGRTIEEMIEIMSVVPSDVYAAIDMNHIKQPEKLINALGSRIKSVHICDGNGEKERHYLPGRGDNNWNLILLALDQAAYEGPFMYEIRVSEIKTFEELKSCYDSLYNDYVEYLDKIRPIW